MSSTEIAKSNGGNGFVPALSTREAEAFVKKYVCEKANADNIKEIIIQLAAFGYDLNDVVKKKVHVVPFGAKYGIVISIHEMLARADKTGELDGIETTSDGGNGKKPTEATATVYRKTCSRPFVKRVFWSEYAAQNSMWNNKPNTMLEKVALAQTLRLAFPLNLEGLYATEEIQEAEYVVETKQQPQSQPQSVLPEPEKKQQPKSADPDKPTVGEKATFLRRCEATKRILAHRGVPEDVYKKVYGNEGFIMLEEVNSLKAMGRIADEYKRITQATMPEPAGVN